MKLLEAQFGRRLENVSFLCAQISKNQTDRLRLYTKMIICQCIYKSRMNWTVCLTGFGSAIQNGLNFTSMGPFSLVLFDLILDRIALPYSLPWSQTFYLSCQDVSLMVLFRHYFNIFRRYEDSFKSFILSLKGYLSTTETSTNS